MTKISSVTWRTATGEMRSGFRVTYSVAGKKKFKQSTDLKEIQRFVRRLESHISTETVIHKFKDAPTVATVADAWLRACKSGRADQPPLQPETLKTYKSYVENYIKRLIGDTRISEIERKDCITFRAELLEECSRPTAKKIFTAFRSVLGYAIDNEIIVSDPSHKMTIKVGRHKRRIEIHTKKNMAKLISLACALVDDPDRRTAKAWKRNSLMLMLLVYCGLRLSELRGLPRSALDLKHAKLTVKQRADRTGLIGPPKSERGHRTLYIPDVLLEPLADWLKSHKHDLVFPSASGEALDQGNIRKRMWVEIQTKAKVPHYNIHSTRHFYASRLIESGATIKEVSTDMGHADESFTVSVYGHLFKDSESERRRRDRIDSLVLPTQSQPVSEPD